MKKATRKAAPASPAPLKASTKKSTLPKSSQSKSGQSKSGQSKSSQSKSGALKSAGPKKSAIAKRSPPPPHQPPPPAESGAAVLDRLHAVIIARRMADPAHSHSARLLARGPAKVAQKFGEEAVECLIEAVAGDTAALVAESADVLYHLLVMWVAAGVAPNQVWAELHRREGVSGVAEKTARLKPTLGTTKIP